MVTLVTHHLHWLVMTHCIDCCLTNVFSYVRKPVIYVAVSNDCIVMASNQLLVFLNAKI